MTMTAEDRRLVLSGLLAMTAGFGVARFLYTPLLPPMQAALGFSDTTAGLVASINYVGYLFGALWMSTIKEMATKWRVFRLGLVGAVLTTAAMGLTEDVVLWSALRFVSGLGSATTMVIGASLILKAIPPARSGLALGVYMGGAGLGIVLGGVMTMGLSGSLSWAGLWLAGGAVTLVLALPSLTMRRPEPSQEAADGHGDHPPTRVLSVVVLLLLAAYFCEGIGYVVSATFLVAILKAMPALSGLADASWVVVGLAAAPSALFWMALARRFGVLGPMVVAYLAQAVGIVLPVIVDGPLGGLMGAVLFGGTFMGIVTMMLNLGARMMPEHPARLMGLLTACFGVAQIVGPAVSGWIADLEGTFRLPLIGAALIAALGGVLIVAVGRTEAGRLAATR